MRRLLDWLAWAVPTALLAGILAPGTAHAIPAYATQTGQPCSACHVGSFGPMLTPFGRAFKIGGYTMGGGDGLASKIPLSAMVLGSFTNTRTDQPGPAATHYSANNNAAIDQISVFLGGKVNDHIGGFLQTTYGPIDDSIALDNTDLRLTDLVTVGNTDLRVGMSLNNGPTVQDPYNSTFAWGYPFVASSLAPTPAAAPLLAGALLGNTTGLTAYAWWNSSLYGEFGVYRTMSNRLAQATGNFPGAGSAPGLIPYVRLAYEWNWAGQSAHIGGMFLHAALEPTRVSDFGTDKYTDFAVDGSYQFMGDGTNIVTLYGIYTHEDANLDATFAGGGAAQSHHTMDDARLNLSYYYKNTYGLTLGVVRTVGSSDPVMWAPNPLDGSRTGKPDSTAFTVEADWIPFGKDNSWGAPFANLKLGAQYTAYTQFNGSSSNYDGSGRSASANNTFYAFAWMAF